jgi:hypothetical protein
MELAAPFLLPDYVQRGLKNFPDFTDLERRVRSPPAAPNTLLGISICFPAPPRGVGPPNKLTLMSVANAMPESELSPDQWAVVKINAGTEVFEFAVAAVCLWLGLMPPDVRALLRDTPLWLIPITEWGSDDFKAWLDACRATSAVSADDTEGIAYNWIRKLNNLRGRNLEPADWDAEWERWRYNRSWHWWLTRGGMKSRAMHHGVLMEELQKITDGIVGDVVASGHLQTLDEWWSQRSLWCPSGSSSARHRLDEHKKNINELRDNDRPTKKSVAETYTLDDLTGALSAVPRVLARESTKHEPGEKNRALVAADDMSTFIASYASQDVERHMAIGGMVARQTPQDVVEWLRAELLGTTEEHCWLSLDYSDFNKEHDAAALAGLNLCFARSWLRSGVRPEVAMQKAACSVWTGMSHFNVYIKHAGSQLRAVHALLSGHRNTARDNTILHLAYSRVARRNLQELGICVQRPVYEGFCGDDEDVLHRTWQDAVFYYCMHCEANHNLQPQKQQVGRGHEFLQRGAQAGRLPMRPICTTIATIASGNWYKQHGHFFDAAIKSYSDYGWELVQRGGDCGVVQRLVAGMLNWHMRTRGPKGDTIKLEWWEFADPATMPLWRDCVKQTLPLPMLPPTSLPTDRLPAGGVQDLMEARWRWFCHVPDNQKSAWKKHMLHEVHKGFFGSQGERQRLADASELWPRRSTRNVRALCQTTTLRVPIAAEVVQTFSRDVGTRQPPKLAAALQRIGLDETLFNMMGGWPWVLAHGRPQDGAVYEQELAIDTRMLPSWVDDVDPALASWLKSTNN